MIDGEISMGIVCAKDDRVMDVGLVDSEVDAVGIDVDVMVVVVILAVEVVGVVMVVSF